VEGNSRRREVLGEDMGRKAGLLLIEIHRYEIEANRCPPLEHEQEIEQAIAVFPTRDAHHDLVAILDQPILGDGLADETKQAGLQLLGGLIEFGQ